MVMSTTGRVSAGFAFKILDAFDFSRSRFATMLVQRVH